MYFRNYADVWMPDKEFMEQYRRPVMFPNEITSQWKLPPFNRKFNLSDYDLSMEVSLRPSTGVGIEILLV